MALCCDMASPRRVCRFSIKRLAGCHVLVILRRELAILSPGAIEPRLGALLPSVDSYHQRCTFRTLLRVEIH